VAAVAATTTGNGSDIYDDTDIFEISLLYLTWSRVSGAPTGPHRIAVKVKV
jgi:hypothetical protein